MQAKVYAGIVIPDHKIVDAESKDRAQASFTGWQFVSLTAPDWMQRLSQGQTIQPSAFSPQPDGTFTHKKGFWQSTHFICADADNIKGVEKLKDGSEKNPEGIESFTEQDGLSKRYPTLSSKVYAVGQSVSSMLREPLHRRYRLIFLFDQPITTVDHYNQILKALAKEFPIIPAVDRSPAQPVFGNAREGFGVHICGKVLSLDDYPYTPPAESKNESQTSLDFDETLEDYLRRHGIAYTPASESDKFFVECPYKGHHTGGINKLKDAYVFSDSGGWSFYCSHESCKKANRNKWQVFKDGMGIKTNGTPKKPKKDSKAKVEKDESPFFSGRMFLPLAMRDYLNSEGIRTLSLRHEPFLRVYRDGVYVQENGEVLNAMQEVLGSGRFKMAHYNEVVSYLSENITPPDQCEHPNFLNLKNGMLNLDSLEKTDHDPKVFSLTQMPVEWHENADCPVISDWLSDVLDNDDTQIKLFLESIGYTLLGTTALQKMFILLGRTQTGKSTAMHIMKALIGKENTSAMELSSLEDETNRFSRSQIHGKIANFSADISPKYLTGDGNIKKIISGDPITAEHKFKDPFIFEPNCTLWAMANELPASRDKSGAWYERLVIFRFEKQFLAGSGREPNRNLKKDLTTPEELSGLLLSALCAGKNAINRGAFSIADLNREALTEYIAANDHVMGFCQDMPDTFDWEDNEFFSTYKEWCEDEGIDKPLSKNRLAHATARYGIRRIRKKEDGKRFFAWKR